MQFLMHGLDNNNKAQSLKRLQDMGIRGIVSGFDEEAIALTAEQGMKAYVCTHAFTAEGQFGENPYLAEDVHGQKHVWFNSACPNHPEIQKDHLRRIDTWSRTPGVSGIYVDGARFSSPCSSADFRSFFTCFCPHCAEKAAALGFDFERMQHDVQRLLSVFEGRESLPLVNNLPYGGVDLLVLLNALPGVGDWLRFRAQSIAEHMADAAATLRAADPDAVLGMYIFSPSIAPWVGQDYSQLRQHVDVFAPMIYRSLQAGEGPACLNKETSRLGRELVNHDVMTDENAVAFLQTLTGFPLSEYATVVEVDRELPVAAVQMETQRARNLLGSRHPLLPIIQLDDDGLAQSTAAALAGGADGVNFFVYMAERLPLLQKVLNQQLRRES